MEFACGDRGQTEKCNSGRHDHIRRPLGSSALYDQGTEHRATAKATQQNSVSDRAAVYAMSDGRQQSQEAASEEHCCSCPGELETLRQFLAFCLDRKWIAENPAKKIKPPRNVRPAPVVPYTAAELEKISTAAGTIGKGDYERLRARAAVLLLRHTALRISDVALLEHRRVEKGALLLQTKKTGGTISLPLPDDLLAALEALPMPRGADPENSRYFFINGAGSARTAISVMERCLRAVFKASGVVDAHAHRFRHTMATEILANGGTLADVADILGISESIAGKHHAKWNQARQDRIGALMRVMHAGTNRARGKKLVVIAS
jgi:site-specific recombinase XerD